VVFWHKTLHVILSVEVLPDGSRHDGTPKYVLQCVVVCCSVLQCVAVCCSAAGTMSPLNMYRRFAILSQNHLPLAKEPYFDFVAGSLVYI